MLRTYAAGIFGWPLFNFPVVVAGQSQHERPMACPAGWGRQQQNFLASHAYDACTVSHTKAYGMAKGRAAVHFKAHPLEDWLLPGIEPMNKTAGEQWTFDGVSEDGMQSFIIGHYRDPNYSIIGAGNLRVSAEFSFGNGTRHAQLNYAEESTIESCPGVGARGIWKGRDFTYSFAITADMRRPRLQVDSPKANVSITLGALAPPRYADSSVWPSEATSMLAVPHFYFVEPIPVGEVAVGGIILGAPISWTGIGGFQHLWSAFNWYTTLRNMEWVKLRAGPYALTTWLFGSGRDKDVEVNSVILAKDGEKIFGSRNTIESTTEDYFQMKKTYGSEDGGISGHLNDKATGFQLELISPLRNEKWIFNVTHQSLAFEFPVAQGTGGMGFCSRSQWGRVGTDELFKGPALTEILTLPRRSLILKNNYVE